MSSLADLPELVGFFSYSREDDEEFNGSLSALRDGIQRELRAQLGRSNRDFRLWQDKESIPLGSRWEIQVREAINQSAFFIPVITPQIIKSRWLEVELDLFLARENQLGRQDLIFPILYVGVPALDDEREWRQHAVLKIIATRQYFDWRSLRHRDLQSTDVAVIIERFCMNIRNVLRMSSLSPAEPSDQNAETGRVEYERRRRAAVEKAPADTTVAQKTGLAQIGHAIGVKRLLDKIAPKVFISYRRDDSKYQAKMIHAALVKALPQEHVFMDIDSVPLGADFVEILEGWVDQCDILLALIGPGWVDAMDSKTGRRRLDSSEDFVRVEVREGLRRGIPVVPVMLDRAPMPDVNELPEDVRKLARRQAEFIEFRTFDTDVARLIKKLGLGR